MTTNEAKQSGYFLLNTDGGMFNDGKRKRDDPPGDAAIAVVLKDHKDRLIEGFSGSIGPETNDIAEYRALIEGLKFALNNGVTQIRSYVDSEFVVDQLNGRSVPRQEDTELMYAEATALLKRFTDWRISWVPRERNREADALVRAILYD